MLITDQQLLGSSSFEGSHICLLVCLLAGVMPKDMLKVYLCNVRSVLEYAV